MVVTIVVLLILAGITIVYVFGENGVFGKASKAKEQTEIAKYQEMLETAKSPIIIDGLGTFEPEAYFEYIEKQGITESKDGSVIDNGDETYEVTTKPGYVFLVTLMPTPEKPTDAEIEYLGQAGKIPPVIRRIEVSATATSITGKAIISRLGNGTVTYYYKLSTAGDDSYTEITNVNSEAGATQSSGITAGEKYTIKVVAKNGVGEAVKTAEIIATKIFIESITLEDAEIKVEKTITLTPIVLPENATNKNITWESYDTTIATVNENGVVTGKKEGTTTITANSTDGSNKTASCTITVKLPMVADIENEQQTEPITVKDENGNKVVIPDGFRILPHGTENADIVKVEYNYDDTHKPCVQDGIVIADSDDNQFVWIPVGKIKNKDNTTTTITLGRYSSFSASATPVQTQANYSANVTINSYFQESINQTGENIHAKALQKFVDNAIADNGYWLARYEASGGSRETGTVKSQYDKATWGYISQSTAATVARNMKPSGVYQSDLVNSYAWDTAIIFIEKSGHSGYAVQTTKGTKKLNTGKSGDKVCNIYDMSSNCYEWNTETSRDSASYSPGTLRGGYYTGSNISYDDPSYRKGTTVGNSSEYYSFRCILYRT